mgnify:CR=1 FL=1
MTLHELGVNHNTDKASHGYTHLYDRLFLPLQDKPITLLEIGVYMGSSIKMWRDYFTHPDRCIIGIDTTLQYADGAKGIVLLQDDAGDIGHITSLGQIYHPNIIIDDGSHLAHDQLTSFFGLWPSLSSGDMYIIEDLHGFHPTKDCFKLHIRYPNMDAEWYHNDQLLLLRKT